eukprot:1765658-Alexandrium_andersonii.AAC.1
MELWGAPESLGLMRLLRKARLPDIGGSSEQQWPVALLIRRFVVREARTFAARFAVSGTRFPPGACHRSTPE